MFSVIFFASMACLGVGLIVKTVVDNTGLFDDSYYKTHRRISWTEYGLGAVLACLIVVPGVTIVGTNIAKDGLLEFDEFWNGYETAALVSNNTCSRDGSCRFEYDCDSYNHIHTSTSTDSNGNTQTHISNHTHWHRCPYATSETTYKVTTTLDEFTIDTTIDEDARAWRAGKGIPGDYPKGVPAFWQAAADRLAAGDPGPVTVQRTYDNYVLAAQNTILDKYDGDIDAYLADDLLPDTSMERGLHSYYRGHKVHSMGVPVGDLAEWEFAVDRFNAALGTDLQGDLHLVFVPAEVNGDRYAGSLNAYWTGDTFGDQALSKNAIVVIVGVEAGEIAWSESFTGMPVGNELMLTRLSDLAGTALTPDDLLGRPVGIIADGDVDEIQHTEGAIESAVWATDRPFERICMTCDDPDENGGYGYLAGDVEPTTGQKWGIFAVALLMSSLVWAVFIAVGNHYEGGSGESRGRGSNGSRRTNPGRPSIY